MSLSDQQDESSPILIPRRRRLEDGTVEDLPPLDAEALETWYAEYLACKWKRGDKDPIQLTSIDDDVLDDAEVEKQVQSLVPLAGVFEGYCAKCRQQFLHWKFDTPSRAGKAWWMTIAGLEAASRAGCLTCGYFFSSIPPGPEGFPGEFVHTLHRLRRLERRLSLLGLRRRHRNFYVVVESEATTAGWRGFLLSYPGQLRTEPGPFAHFLCATDVESDDWLSGIPPTDFMNRFDLVKVWLERCGDNHPQCQLPKSPERPRRLVSVLDDAVRVVDSESFAEFPPYATLSYCWGRSDFTMLTEETIDTFQKEGISFSELPRTFQDAITVTRSISLGYIWIDALCIIQRQASQHDWSIESAKMRSIYSGGYVNMAAAHTSNVHEGFLHKLDGSRDDGGVSPQVYSSQGSHRQVFYTFHSSPTWEVFHETDLSSRGWCFQERLLPMRTIHLTKYGIYWECRCKFASESLPAGFGDAFRDVSNYAFSLARPDDELLNWDEVVKTYSRSLVTVGSDRLPALAGVARRYAETAGIPADHYVAGIWRDELIRQLLWAAVPPSDEDSSDSESESKSDPLPPTKRPNWRAPTWSWAAAAGEVEFQTFWTAPWGGRRVKKKTHARVLDVYMPRSGVDPFGAVSDGSLKLACSHLIEGAIMRDTAHDPPKIMDYISVWKGHRPFEVKWDFGDDELILESNDIYLLPLMSGHVIMEEGHTDSWAYSGLVLQHIEGSKGQFRRLGAFEFREYTPWSELVGEVDGHVAFLDVLRQVGGSTAARLCIERDQDEKAPKLKYVIVLR